MPQNKRKFVGWRLRLREGVSAASHGDLESADSWLESFGIVCGAMVFFGVAFEVFIAAENPPYSSIMERWGSTVADALVAFGVLGEVVAASRGRVIQSELTRRSNGALAEATKTAGDANERASQADLKRVQLEEKLAPRSFLLSDVERLKEALIQFRGVRANVMPCAGFPEVARATWLLTSALRECEWRIEPMHSPDPMWSFEGICVGTEEGAQEADEIAAKALIEGLNSVGWATTSWMLALPVPFIPVLLIDQRSFAPIRIMIGYKPDPLFPKVPPQTGAP